MARIALACRARHPDRIERRRYPDGRLHLRRLDVRSCDRRRAGRSFRRTRTERRHIGFAVFVDVGAREPELLEHGAARWGGTNLLFRAVIRGRPRGLLQSRGADDDRSRRRYLKIAFGIVMCTPFVPSTTCVTCRLPAIEHNTYASSRASIFSGARKSTISRVASSAALSRSGSRPIEM